MSGSYGGHNPDLSKAVNAIAKLDTSAIGFTVHAEIEMDNDGFDHEDVLLCLRRGKAFGPEKQGGELRANVVHRGLQIRVSIGSIEQSANDWSELRKFRVVTVMRQI
jgi:hypothetical protein